MADKLGFEDGCYVMARPPRISIDEFSEAEMTDVEVNTQFKRVDGDWVDADYGKWHFGNGWFKNTTLHVAPIPTNAAFRLQVKAVDGGAGKPFRVRVGVWAFDEKPIIMRLDE